MLESGECAAITEMAEREGIAHSSMTRFLRPTLLASEIVSLILKGRAEVALADLLKDVPVEGDGA